MKRVGEETSTTVISDSGGRALEKETESVPQAAGQSGGPSYRRGICPKPEC